MSSELRIAANDNSPITVRLIDTEKGRDDAKAVATMLVSSHEEVGVAPVDPGQAYKMILDAIENEAVFMAEIDGKIVGTLCLEMAPLWYAPKQHFLTNLWFFVPGEKRNGAVTRALINEARSLARDTGLPLMVMRPTALEIVH